MKKLVLYISVLSLVLFSSCYDDDISYSKPGKAITPVSSLEANALNDSVSLTWDLPSNYPEAVVQPLSVIIYVSIDGIREGGGITLNDNPQSYIYKPYDSAKNYKFTVKVMASLMTTKAYESDLFYSSGSTIAL